jgi:hypothetical protein
MLHGKGTQAFLTEDYEEERRDLLRDSTDITDLETSTYEVTGSQGRGRTNPDTYKMKQFPFPTDTTIRRKETIDLRKVKPELGEMSD